MDIELDEALWKDIPGYENLYQCHPEGKVRNKTNGRIFYSKPKPGFYITISLQGKGFLVHRLVAMTFLENPLNLPFVNHIDGVKDNPKLSNLEWISASDNVKHGIAMGRKKSKPTLCRPVRVTTRDGVSTDYNSIVEASEALNVKFGLVSQCLNGSGVYTGGRSKEWKWKIERIDDSIPLDPLVEERKVSLEGFENYTICSNGVILNERRKEIGRPNLYGYVTVMGTNRKIRGAHVLVAHAFLPKIPGKDFVNHLDGVKHHNFKENLCWCSKSENSQHAYDTGLTRPQDTPKDRFPVLQLEFDGTILKRFASVTEANDYMNSSVVTDICKSYINNAKKRSTLKGFGFCYERDYTEPKPSETFLRIFPELSGRTDIDFNKIRPIICEGIRPFWQIDFNGNRIKMWYSLTDAVESVTQTDISALCMAIKSNGSRMCGKFIWQNVSYEDIINPNNDYVREIPKSIRKRLQLPNLKSLKLTPEVINLICCNFRADGKISVLAPIAEITLDGEIIKLWPGATFLTKHYNTPRYTFSNAIETGKVLFGSRWRKMTPREMCTGWEDQGESSGT